MENIRDKFVKGSVWALFENISLKLVSFVVTLVLARLLTPADYGLIALLSIFIAVANVIVESGFGSALVQKKDATEMDFNSVFYLSVSISFLAYLTLFFASPWIARFYNEPELKAILRVISIPVVFHAINSIQNAELRRKMLFNLSFRISLLSSVISGILGVSLAMMGLGAWALVYSSVVGSLVNVFASWFIIAWRPKLMFSWKAVRNLFSFGWKLTLDSFANMLFDNVYGLVIGRVYRKEDLAYVNKGMHLPSLFMQMVNGTLCKTAFPTLAQLQNEQSRIREATRRMVKCSAFIVFPLMGFCCVCAPKIIRILFGGQWDASIPYAQFACFQFAFWPLGLVQQSLLAIGRSDVLLKINLVRKLFGFAVMAATIWISPLVFVGALALVYSPLAAWSNSWPNKRLFGYSFSMQLKDVSLLAVNTLLMVVFVFVLGLVLDRICVSFSSIYSMIAIVLVQLVSGGFVYLVLSRRTKVAVINDYIDMFMPVAKRINLRLASIIDLKLRVA